MQIERSRDATFRSYSTNCANACRAGSRRSGKQVSTLQTEVELFEERNPANPDSQVAEATLHLKGVTLRAREASRDLKHSINLISDELARQVKRHRDKRRKRREQRAAAGSSAPIEEGPGEAAAAR